MYLSDTNVWFSSAFKSLDKANIYHFEHIRFQNGYVIIVISHIEMIYPS